MKSFVTVLFVLVFNSLAFAAMGDQAQPTKGSTPQPDKKSTISLTDGFLSLFDFFVFKPATASDTLKVNVPRRPDGKEGAVKKS